MSKKESSQDIEIVDESNITLLPQKAKKIDLHNAHSIRREMASVYRDVKAGKIDPTIGTKLIYMLDANLKAYKVAVQDDQIERIQIALKIRDQ